MASRNRTTLKNYFEQGARPSNVEFHDLIDSCLNLNDDGFHKSPSNGVEISTQDDHDGLIGFYRSRSRSGIPLWSFELKQVGESKEEALVVSHFQKGPVLTLMPDGRVGIGETEPECTLDVGGTLASWGRTGGYRRGKIPADGTWWDITEPINGCNAFEVMAGTGGMVGTGHYAVAHGIAVNAYNPSGFMFNFLWRKKRIRITQSFYRSGADKIKLRWHARGDRYVLQMKTASPYAGSQADREAPESYPFAIQYNLTKLWFDEALHESRQTTETETK